MVVDSLELWKVQKGSVIIVRFAQVEKESGEVDTALTDIRKGTYNPRNTSYQPSWCGVGTPCSVILHPLYHLL